MKLTWLNGLYTHFISLLVRILQLTKKFKCKFKPANYTHFIFSQLKIDVLYRIKDSWTTVDIPSCACTVNNTFVHYQYSISMFSIPYPYPYPCSVYHIHVQFVKMVNHYPNCYEYYILLKTNC